MYSKAVAGLVSLVFLEEIVFLIVCGGSAVACRSSSPNTRNMNNSPSHSSITVPPPYKWEKRMHQQIHQAKKGEEIKIMLKQSAGTGYSYNFMGAMEGSSLLDFDTLVEKFRTASPPDRSATAGECGLQFKHAQLGNEISNNNVLGGPVLTVDYVTPTKASKCILVYRYARPWDLSSSSFVQILLEIN